MSIGIGEDAAGESWAGRADGREHLAPIIGLRRVCRSSDISPEIFLSTNPNYYQSLIDTMNLEYYYLGINGN